MNDLGNMQDAPETAVEVIAVEYEFEDWQVGGVVIPMWRVEFWNAEGEQVGEVADGFTSEEGADEFAQAVASAHELIGWVSA